MYIDLKIMLIYNQCLIIKLRNKFTNEFFSVTVLVGMNIYQSNQKGHLFQSPHNFINEIDF